MTENLHENGRNILWVWIRVDKNWFIYPSITVT